jgi:hypothetical protein
VELLIAGVITAFLLGAVSVCLRQLTDARLRSRMNLEAYVRADAALAALRRDVISVLRDPDLFFTRFLLFDGTENSPLGHLDRDEFIVFNTALRPIRDLDFMGDGMEFETQYRIQEDALGAVLWQRRDAVPDEYPRGGGTVTPLAAGVVSLGVEAYDGDLWYPEWDSDYDGLPRAVRITVTASGQRAGEDAYDAPLATLRTVVPIDRVLPPPQEPPAELAAEGETPEATDAAGDSGQTEAAGSGGTNTLGGRGITAPGGGGRSRPRGGPVRSTSPARPGRRVSE